MVTIDSVNGLSSAWCQTIYWTNANLLSLKPLKQHSIKFECEMWPVSSDLIVLNYSVIPDYVMKLMTLIREIADMGRKIHISRVA